MIGTVILFPFITLSEFPTRRERDVFLFVPLKLNVFEVGFIGLTSASTATSDKGGM